MGDLAVTAPQRLILRYADVGVATYASLRVAGRPSRTVTWVIEEPILLAALAELADALPEPQPGEDRDAALERALTRGPFAAPEAELTLAYILGVLLLSAPAWQLLVSCVASPRPVLHITPSARLAHVPWGMLALPVSGPSAAELAAARQDAITRSGTVAADIPWQLADIGAHTEGYRLMELADVLLAVPLAVAHAARCGPQWQHCREAPALLVLDPRIPGRRADSALGSVLGRPSESTILARHFAGLRRSREVRPQVGSVVELFRRTDADRRWLADQLGRPTSRLLFVGHVSAAEDHLGRADRAALHLAEQQPVTAAALTGAALRIPPRVALLACASGGDYRFDEATGLVAAMVRGGAQVVTATLWPLITTAGYRRYRPGRTPAPAAPIADPLAEVVVAVDEAHEHDDAGYALNRWQRDRMRRWRHGDLTASPLYWAGLVTFTVGGVR